MRSATLVRILTKLVSVLLFITALAGAPRSAPNIDDSLSFAVPSNPQISPDGSQVVYQVSRTNWKQNTFEADLWIADIASPHQLRKLHAGPGWSGEPRWSPDGQTVAFVSDRSGRRELFVIAARGGEARKLTSVESGIGEFRWAPDSASLAFTADTDPDRNAERARRYGDFEIVKEDPAGIAGLWRVRLSALNDAPLDKPEALLVDGKYAVGTFAWSPDGTRIAFQADGVYLLDVASHSVKPVASGAGPYRNPVWSPDGSSIAFETAGGDAGFYYANWFIAKVPASGGAVEPLTKAFDENVDLVAWTPAGVFFGALQRTASHLFTVDAASHRIRRVTQTFDKSGDAIAWQFSVTPDGSQFAFVRGDGVTLPEISAATADGRATRLTDGTADAASFQFARRELVRWKSTDGTEIEGILYKPADFNPAKKYALLVAIHGGPVALDQPALRPDRYYPIEQFVARGALVLRPNYRGSAGYGAEFRALPVRNLGTGDTADVVSGVDYLIGKGFIDPDRVGAMGWSEGGYISAFLATASNRFAAVSVGAGVSDWTTYYVNTDIAPFTRQYLKATPWSEPEVYRTASPVTYVNKANTPVLIQHGEEDRRVPVANAYELRQALEDRKIPVRMIVYKGMGHSIDRPKQQRAVMEQNLDWFDRWIFGGNSKPAVPLSITRSSTTKAAGDSQ
jgi:dipeptidyl aminopeptidase/acylaminoacyl peptidase